MTEMPPDWMILYATRYCLGRMSYAVGEMCDWLVANWSRIPLPMQNILRRDVEEAFARDDRDREDHDGSGPKWFALGMDMDRRQWERVRELWTGK